MFQMLAFEVAAQEYAYAVAYQRLEEEDLDASDILNEVRNYMNDLTRNMAEVVRDLAELAATR